MQFQAIELQQRVEEPMRGHAEFSHVKCRASHNVSCHWSGGRRNMTGS
jgi:hypothetical protein